MEGQRQFVGSYRRTIPRDGVCGVRPIPPSLQGVRYHQPVTTATKLVCVVQDLRAGSSGKYKSDTITFATCPISLTSSAAAAPD